MEKWTMAIKAIHGQVNSKLLIKKWIYTQPFLWKAK